MILLVLALLRQSPVERYLDEKDKSARAKILSEIKAPIAEVEAELRKPPKRASIETRGQIVKKKLKADHPLALEFEYVLWVPKDYEPEKSWRLIVSLHGQSGNGDQFIRNWLGDAQRDGATFVLCPSAQRGGWGHSTLGYHYILDSLRDVLATYAVDRDLVFLDGASMGGNGSFQFACMFPDLFAAAAPRSGGPMFRYVPTGPGKNDRTVTAEGLENLIATPLYWVVGAKDGEVPNAWVKIAKAQLDALKTDFTFREFPDGGHEWFPQENRPVLDWMATKRRTAYPDRVGLDTNERAFSRNFWLEITEFKGQELLKRSYMDFDKKAIEERSLFPEHAHARGEIVRESNEIKLTVSGAREVRVYLHEKMVELAKPVTITVNGSKSKFEVKPTLETLLESARRDRGLLYSATVKVRVP